MSQTLHFVGMGGSLRKGSFSRAMLEAAKDLLPADVTFEIIEVGDFPLYNTDLEASMPAVVQKAKDAIKKADAILFASPEYDYSVPGFLKNAVDWISRPYGDNSFDGKVVGLMSSSSGQIAGSRAYYHWRQVFQYLNTVTLSRPEVMMPGAGDKVDASGVLTDQHSKDKIKELLAEMKKWTLQLRK